MYQMITTTTLYDGSLPFAAPICARVIGCDGVERRANYVDGSMIDHFAARYVVEGQLCQLGRDGVLRAVANEERRAA